MTNLRPVFADLSSQVLQSQHSHPIRRDQIPLVLLVDQPLHDVATVGAVVAAAVGIVQIGGPSSNIGMVLLSSTDSASSNVQLLAILNRSGEADGRSDVGGGSLLLLEQKASVSWFKSDDGLSIILPGLQRARRAQ